MPTQTPKATTPASVSIVFWLYIVFLPLFVLGIIWKALLGVWDSGPSGFHSGEILYLLFFVYAYVSVMLLRMGKRLGLVLFTISFIISGAMAAVEQFNNLSRLDTTWGFYLLIVGSLLALMWYRDRAYFT